MRACAGRVYQYVRTNPGVFINKVLVKLLRIESHRFPIVFGVLRAIGLVTLEGKYNRTVTTLHSEALYWKLRLDDIWSEFPKNPSPGVAMVSPRPCNVEPTSSDCGDVADEECRLKSQQLVDAKESFEHLMDMQDYSFEQLMDQESFVFESEDFEFDLYEYNLDSTLVDDLLQYVDVEFNK